MDFETVSNPLCKVSRFIVLYSISNNFHEYSNAVTPVERWNCFNVIKNFFCEFMLILSFIM